MSQNLSVKKPRKIRHKHLYLNRSPGGNIAILFFLALVGVFMALPLVYSVSSALKPLDITIVSSAADGAEISVTFDAA